MIQEQEEAEIKELRRTKLIFKAQPIIQDTNFHLSKPEPSQLTGFIYLLYLYLQKYYQNIQIYINCIK